MDFGGLLINPNSVYRETPMQRYFENAKAFVQGNDLKGQALYRDAVHGSDSWNCMQPNINVSEIATSRTVESCPNERR